MVTLCAVSRCPDAAPAAIHSSPGIYCYYHQQGHHGPGHLILNSAATDKSRMSLYFDVAINSGSSSGNIHVNTAWHSTHALLAVGSYSEEKGGYVSLYTDDGEQVERRRRADEEQMKSR